MRRFIVIPALAFILLLSTITVVNATIGVGVGTGKIQVDEDLKSGMSYKMPSLTVLNTGDEPSDYTVGIAYHQDQPELAPPKEWFSFSPEVFYLEPAGAQIVEVTLNLPLNTRPGDYFAYLEGKPKIKSVSGQTSIGVAAAAKMYFTIAPANIVEAVYYKIAGYWNEYQPWTNMAGIIVLLLVVAKLFRKYVNLEINVKKKDKVEDE